MKKLFTITIVAILFASPASAEVFKIDKGHSRVGFSVKHMVITNVNGNFKEYEGSFDFDLKSKTLKKATVKIKADSIDTGMEKRDKHLRSPEFLNVDKFPKIIYKLTKITNGKDGNFTMIGDLTLHGVTKQIKLEAEFLGSVTDPWGNLRAGFTASGKINRTDYGISYNKLLEAGGLMVAHDVKFIIDIEGILAKKK